MRTTIGLRYCPSEKNAQRRRLAAQLVLGVVQVGEVLDLRDRQRPRQRRAERGAQDGLLVEQRVEDPAAAEPLTQPAGHAVHPALDGDVLTEDQRVRAVRQDVGEGRVDRLGQRQPAAGGSVHRPAGDACRRRSGARDRAQPPRRGVEPPLTDDRCAASITTARVAS